MKKYKFEFIVLAVNIIYMILELIASRLLSPYFGNSTIVWTSVIGIILLSSSVGNYIGGIIADKQKLKEAIKLILLLSGIFVFIIPIIQTDLLNFISLAVNNIKVGAILSTIFLFFVPSMLIGFISPIITKIKLENLENAGKIAGTISAIGTLGCILGDFLGGFYLIPSFGSNAILYFLAVLLWVLILFVEKPTLKTTLTVFVFAVINFSLFGFQINYNNICSTKVLAAEPNTRVTFDTQYGRAIVANDNNSETRILNIDGGNESATYIAEDKKYELVYEYTRYYNLMFRSKNKITNTLLIGGAGFSYPKYYISHFKEKNMDVVEIDEKVIALAKEYFYLNDLIEEFDTTNSKRLNIYADDGRIYLNRNTKKYDAILNDAFAGDKPAETLTTIEGINKIYDSLNPNGMYLTNIIASVNGQRSLFLKSEIKTLKEVFKNVYVVPCNTPKDLYVIQNFMVIATDQNLTFDNAIEIDSSEGIILTDNFAPIENLIK